MEGYTCRSPVRTLDDITPTELCEKLASGAGFTAYRSNYALHFHNVSRFPAITDGAGEAVIGAVQHLSEFRYYRRSELCCFPDPAAGSSGQGEYQDGRTGSGRCR